MIECKRCHKEWDYEEEGLLCPACHASARPEASELAALFSRAVALEQDRKHEAAFRRYGILAQLGIPEGEEAYARCFQMGIGTPRDPARAADGYLDAAEHGSVRAAYRLGRLLMAHPRLADGRGTPAMWLRAAAALGSADAAFALATSGDRLGISAAARHSYLDMAFRGGHTAATRRLVWAYLVGSGTERSVPMARAVYNTLPRRGILRFVFRFLLKNPPPKVPPVAIPASADDLCALGNEAMKNSFPSTALRLFLLAADGGSVAAAVRAGAAYHEGLGTLPDLDAAVMLYRRAEEQGSPEAALVLGRIYEKERADLAEAERHYLNAAEQGTAEHQYILGDFYLANDKAGEGVRRAVPWLRRAASGGCIPAADRLSGIDTHLTETYNRAVEAQKNGNVREAFLLYENAAALGYAAALSNLGYCLQKGIGCVADRRAAARAYREAVTAGSEPAKLNLAACYMNGIGIRRDFAAARALLSDVCEEYRETAANLLARMEEARTRHRAHRLYAASAAAFHRGDVAEALRLRVAAARLGSSEASYAIGCHFEFGDAVPLDREKASAWYEAAAAAGYTGSHARIKGGYLRERRRFSQA